MKILRLAKSYMRQAGARVDDAEKALKEENYPYGVRLSQEAVELSLKASLRLVGIEYPKIHDVSSILKMVKDRFPDWFKDEVVFLVETSKNLSKKRGLSFYGIEVELLSPEDLITKDDAEDAVIRAKKAVELCEKLLKQYERSYA
ncbi:MAG: HEPN domain-containing protein [Candidatus Hodarchaeota archaeon]